MRHHKMLWATAKLAVVAGVTAIALTGCADESNGISKPPPVEATTASPSSTDSADGASKEILAAGNTALQKVKNSAMGSIESEDAGWNVIVFTFDGAELELMISTDGSKILDGPNSTVEDAKDKAKHKNRVKSVQFDWTKAVKKIQTAFQGGTITELELDSERGKTVWEADVIDGSNNKHEITIDAASGKVLKNEKDN